MEFLRQIITALRILLLIGHLWSTKQAVEASPDPDKGHERALRLERQGTKQATLSPTIEERRARELIQGWCSAYSQLNPPRIAELQASEIEIVDQFGDLHRLSARKDQERFWAEGFDIIQAGEFHPQCEAVDIVFISPQAAMVHVNVSYPHGISLKGGERIPPYSEIHTLVITENEGPWLISGHNVTKQVSP